MGCIASAFTSCCCSCAGTACGSCCSSALSKTTSSRIPYLVLMFLTVVLALVARYTSGWVLHLYWFSFDVCTSTECYGQEAVYRLSAAMCCFFATHALAMLLPSTRQLHYRYWCVKVLLLIVLTILFFVIPNPPFDVYGIIARFVSAVFLLLQIVILIEFAYAWNDSWLSDERIADGGNKWFIAVGVSAFVMLAGSIVLCVFSFLWFTDSAGGECSSEKALIIITILLTFAVTVFSVSPWCPHGNILTSSVVTLYSWYLCYTSLSSDPSSCNTLSTQSTAQIVIGITIAALAVTYAGWNLSNSTTIFGVDEEEVPEPSVGRSTPLIPVAKSSSVEKADAHVAADSDVEEQRSADDVEPSGPETAHDTFLRYRDLKFHLVMACCCMYMAMIITSWGTASTSSVTSSRTSYDLNMSAMWIKIASQWATLLLYAWSLAAPLVFPDREFS